MTPEDRTVVRTSPPVDVVDLASFIESYFVEADRRATARFDELDGIDPAEAARSDLDRLRSASVSDPLFLARADEDVVGMVQLKHLDATTAEIKRLYVRPAHRGEGIGRELMNEALDGAAADGFESVVLGVGPHLDRARSLYEDLDFEYTTPYEQTQSPAVVRDEWCFMRKSLDRG